MILKVKSGIMRLLRAPYTNRWVKPLAKKVKCWIAYYINTRLFVRDPIFIYQMGQVGSMAVRDWLRQNGYKNVHHIHSLNPRYKALPMAPTVSRYIFARTMQSRRPVFVICPIREPIARNLSDYFAREVPKMPDKETVTHSELLRRFLAFHASFVAIEWMAMEFQNVLGIDPYADPFKAYHFYDRGNVHALIYKSELDESRVKHCLELFLCTDLYGHMPISHVNYHPLYWQFKHMVSLPRDYIDRMIYSEYTYHFYYDEIDEIRRKWGAGNLFYNPSTKGRE